MGKPWRNEQPTAQLRLGLRGGRVLKLLLGAVVTLFVSGAAYISLLIGERQEALQQVSRYNVTWLASQAVTELARLQQRIAATAVPGSGIDRDEVQLRLEILANRVGLLRSAEVAEFTAGDDELRNIAGDLGAAVEAAQPLVNALDHPDSARRLIELLSPLDAKLARLAAVANTRSGERVAEDQAQLSRLHWTFSAILAGLLTCGLALMALLLWNNRLLHRAHREMRVLADSLRLTGRELEAANEAIHAANAELQAQNRVLHERDRELHRNSELFEAALNNMSQALCMVDGDQRLIVCNRQFLELFGLAPGQATRGAAIGGIINAIGLASRYPPELIQQIYREQQKLISNDRLATFFREHKEGVALAISHQPMQGGGWVATYEDISERRRTEARITHMAHHDALTSLPNRVLFREQLEQALADSRQSGTDFVLFCLDLDHFKDVNDTLGHPAGDALLEAAARRLRACVREMDVVARLGGDEFAILQVSAGPQEETEALARRLVESVAAPYEIEGQRVIVSVSIGIARAPADGDTADQLLKSADMALYRAKGDGRSTFRFFEPEMDALVRTRRLLELDLREALPGRQLELFYQPLFSLRQGTVSGYEALLRWRHPTRGLVPPAEFIPVMEKIGLINQVGEWVLRQACADAMGWPDHIKLAVNLSPTQFKMPNLVELVSAALAHSGLPSTRLELEVTESVLLQDDDNVLTILHRLQALGLQIAMDDFGTGYSSLSYLRQFPFDKIKIDQSFVREMTNRADCVAIVNSIARLAGSLGMTPAAEGVETEEHLLLVSDAGCVEVQGFYFDEPRPAAELVRQPAPSAARGRRAGETLLVRLEPVKGAA